MVPGYTHLGAQRDGEAVTLGFCCWGCKYHPNKRLHFHQSHCQQMVVTKQLLFCTLPVGLQDSRMRSTAPG